MGPCSIEDVEHFSASLIRPWQGERFLLPPSTGLAFALSPEAPAPTRGTSYRGYYKLSHYVRTKPGREINTGQDIWIMFLLDTVLCNNLRWLVHISVPLSPNSTEANLRLAWKRGRTWNKCGTVREPISLLKLTAGAETTKLQWQQLAEQPYALTYAQAPLLRFAIDLL